jgi:hypothetical protein
LYGAMVTSEDGQKAVELYSREGWRQTETENLGAGLVFIRAHSSSGLLDYSNDDYE